MSLDVVILPAQGLQSIAHTCLADAYYGTYGHSAIFLPDPLVCSLDTLGGPSSEELQTLLAHHVAWTSIPKDLGTNLVWVQEMAVEESVKAREEVDLRLDGADDMWEMVYEAITKIMVSSGEDIDDAEQKVLGGEKDVGQVLYRTPTSSLYALRHITPLIDTALPASFKPYSLPLSPLPFPSQHLPASAGNKFKSKPDHDEDESITRLRAVLAHLKHNTTIATLVSTLSLSEMQHDITYLTGESTKSPIRSRHSFHPDTRVAADWIQGKLEYTGADCEQREFFPGFAPNIIW